MNAVFQAIFVRDLNYGLVGAAFGLSFTYIGMTLFLILYIKIRKLHVNTWYGFSKEAFYGWKEYLMLGLPGALMLYFFKKI